MNILEKWGVKIVADPSIPRGRFKIMAKSEPRSVSASVSIDDIYDEFYDDFATWENGRYWWWVQMVLLEPLEAIINDGENNLYRSAVTVTDQGSGNPPKIEFGDLQPIRLEPVNTTVSDDDDGEAVVAAKREAVMAACHGIASVRGSQKVAASFQSRAEALPESRKKEEQEVREFIARMRTKLNLSADVSDEEVLQRAEEALGQTPPSSDDKPDGDGGTTTTTTTTTTEGDPAPAPTAPDGAATVDASALADLRAAAEVGQQEREIRLSKEDEAKVDEAIKDGKVPARARASYLAQCKRDREGTYAFLDDLEENVVPVAMRGGSSKDEATGGTTVALTSTAQNEDLATYAAARFPEIAVRRAEMAANGGRIRVRTDG